MKINRSADFLVPSPPPVAPGSKDLALPPPPVAPGWEDFFALPHPPVAPGPEDLLPPPPPSPVSPEADAPRRTRRRHRLAAKQRSSTECVHPCNICHKLFTRNGLRDHIEGTHYQHRVFCDRCNNGFRERKDLQQHECQG